ncbi:MAG: metal-dependent hydrolase [Bacteroidota bacterium]|nr:metal-dependent hydrolase [Bacteroidota bacterium]
MKITYYGHSCFSVEIKDKNLLFDPFITPNQLASKIDINKIKADYILISHGHTDHIYDTLEIGKNTDAKIISNYEIVNWLLDKGIKNTHPMNIGGKYNLEFGTIKYVNAIHSSSMPDGSYGGNPGGFVVQSDEGNFYYTGDTGLTYDMKLIGEYINLDFAVMPIGNNYTMGVDNAIIASDYINCSRIIGVHYNTFPIITIDKQEATEKFKLAGKELILLDIEETRNI